MRNAFPPLAASGILVLALLTSSVAAPPRYTVVDLNPSGFGSCFGSATAGGQQVGSGVTSPGNQFHALLWQGSAASAIDLTPTGFTTSNAYGTSGIHQVGNASGPSIGGQQHAMLWSGSPGSFVDLNPPDFSRSGAVGISGNQQVGAGHPTNNDPNDYHALLWSGTAASFVDLHPSGFTRSTAYRTSGAFQVGQGIGTITGNKQHALLWNGSAASAVDLHPTGFDSSIVVDVFGTQQVGAGYDTNSDAHAVLWNGTASSAIDLNPPGLLHSSAHAMNATQQVGLVFGGLIGNQAHAARWSGSASSFVNLHSFLPAAFNHAGAYSTAEGIDALGNVVGSALDSGNRQHAILWVFVPEPRWNVNANGNWSDPANWQFGVPNAVNAIADFTDAITAPKTVTIDSPQTVGFITFDNSNRYTIAGAATLTLDVPTGAASMEVLSGSHTIACPVALARNTEVTIVPALGVLTMSGDLASTVPGVTLTKVGAGVLEIKNIRADGLTISDGAVSMMLNTTSAGASNLKSLTIAGSIDEWTTKLDLNSTLVVDYTDTNPRARITNQVKNGFNLGDWQGDGITSSEAATAAAATTSLKTALGVVQATDLFSTFPASFLGQPIDGTSVLLRYTLSGDADLDGMVNLNDFTRLAASFGLPSYWARGDFNYDGTTTLSDFTILAAQFGQVMPADLPRSSVPEPSTACLIMIGAVMIRRRGCHCRG